MAASIKVLTSFRRFNRSSMFRRSLPSMRASSWSVNPCNSACEGIGGIGNIGGGGGGGIGAVKKGGIGGMVPAALGI